ncbi:MAG: hypothetical protein NVS3B21_08650 [Acidimicrobiales bacterium]
MRLRRAPWVVAVLVTLAASLLGAGPAHADPASDFISRTNALRASKGLPALVSDGRLTSIAQRWAAHMAATGTLSHNGDLQNELPSDWIKYGENVGDGPSVDSIHQAFVNSPHHYANLVDPDFRSIGVAVVIDGRNLLWVVEDFMLEGQSPPPPPPSQPPPPPPTQSPPQQQPAVQQPPSPGSAPLSPSPSSGPGSGGAPTEPSLSGGAQGAAPTASDTATTTTITTTTTTVVSGSGSSLPDIVHRLGALDARS